MLETCSPNALPPPGATVRTFARTTMRLVINRTTATIATSLDILDSSLHDQLAPEHAHLAGELVLAGLLRQ